MIKKFTFLALFISMTGWLQAQVIINEILTNGQIELKNTGADAVDVTSYWLCDFPSYGQVGGQTVICGDLNMPAGSILVISGFALDYTDGELGLYSSSAFSQPTAMLDYVEWGSTGHTRSTVAVAGGIWTTGDFVPAFSASASLEYDGNGDSSTDWVMATGTACDENEAASGGCDVMGGVITTNDATAVCADGTADIITVTVMDNAGTNSGWILTDANNNILEITSQTPLTANFNNIGPGTYIIWHISYEPGLTGLMVGNNASDIMGCFAFANSITVTVTEPLGGTISTTDPTEICALDGVPDPINVSLTGESGTNSNWLITSPTNDILAIETAPPFDLSGAGAGNCFIWHISYENLTGLALGNNVSDLDGCFNLSNSIEVIRTVTDGGSVNAGGSNNIEVCVGDGEPDVVEFSTTSSDAAYIYVITDENNVIVGLPAGNSNDFEGVEEGICRVWGLSFTGDITAQLGDDAAAVALSDECYSLSSDFITVNRVTTGANCALSTFNVDGKLYQLDIIPNPVEEVLNLNIEGQDLDQGRSTISIYSPEGKLVLEKTYQLSSGAQNLELAVDHLVEGLYILQLRNGNKVFNDKFVKR